MQFAAWCMNPVSLKGEAAKGREGFTHQQLYLLLPEVTSGKRSTRLCYLLLHLCITQHFSRGHFSTIFFFTYQKLLCWASKMHAHSCLLEFICGSETKYKTTSLIMQDRAVP